MRVKILIALIIIAVRQLFLVDLACVCYPEQELARCTDPAKTSALIGCPAKKLIFNAHNFADFCCNRYGDTMGETCGCLLMVLPKLEEIVISMKGDCCFTQYCPCVKVVNYTTPGDCDLW